MAGEVRAVCDPDNERAEFALQVAGNWQYHGVGAALLGKMIGYLRARGTRELWGVCLPENRAMGALAARLGFQLRRRPEATELTLGLQAASIRAGN